MGKFKDLTGNKYGQLTVMGFIEMTPNGSLWNCLCDCGNNTSVVVGALSSGNTKSCGCRRSEVVVKRNTIHSLSKLPEYRHWKDMKKRCNNPSENYENYRLKGITVSEEFDKCFVTWLEHIGEKPKDGQRWSVGRIDNTKGYERGNIEWQLADTQAKAHQQQYNNTSGVTGVSVRKNKDGSVRAFVAKLTVDGVYYTKEFTTSAHGEAAFTKAVEYRKYLMEKYGGDFHYSHGVRSGR